MKCAIFDLDGTLVNTIDDLGGTCDYLINKYNFEAKWTQENYKNFVGSGAKILVKKAFKDTLTDDELNDRYEEFKVIYNRDKLKNAYIYDGIVEQLNILKQNSVKLCVVTNKPHDAAVGMVQTLFGNDLFDVIVGAKDDVPKKPDPTTTLIALKKVGCEPKETIYFGDSDIDIKTAKNANVEAIGVSWGYRTFEQLFAENPSVIIDEPKYISKLF